MTDQELYGALEDQPIEYRIFALDRLLKKSIIMNNILTGEAKAANEELIKRHYNKEIEYMRSLEGKKIDEDNVRVIQSLCTEEDKANWWNSMNTSFARA